MVLVLLNADMVAMRVLLRVLGVWNVNAASLMDNDDVADVGNVPYLSVNDEAARASQLSRACWLYAIVVRNLVVACQDSRHMICRSRRTTNKLTVRYGSWWLFSVNHQRMIRKWLSRYGCQWAQSMQGRAIRLSSWKA